MAELKEMSKQNDDCEPLMARSGEHDIHFDDEFDDEDNCKSDAESANENGTIKRQLNRTIGDRYTISIGFSFALCYSNI